MLGRLFSRIADRPGGTKTKNKAATKAGKEPSADKFEAWLAENPGGTFQQFYVEGVEGALAGKKSHASLGPAPNARALNRARVTVDRWIAKGIQPGDLVVDYGCGSLRIGRLLIEYLESDRYIGLDLDERILAAGRMHLPIELKVSKRPVLEVISPESLKRTAAKHPKWVCCKGVLQHVPPPQVDNFFEQISGLILAGATGLFEARTRQLSEQLSSKTWVYSTSDLQASAARFGVSLVWVRFNGRPIFVLTAAR
jgi:hypothetical protein